MSILSSNGASIQEKYKQTGCLDTAENILRNIRRGFTWEEILQSYLSIDVKDLNSPSKDVYGISVSTKELLQTLKVPYIISAADYKMLIAENLYKGVSNYCKEKLVDIDKFCGEGGWYLNPGSTILYRASYSTKPIIKFNSSKPIYPNL